MTDHPAVGLRDVTLRDGLQDEQPIPTADKLRIFEALVAAGLAEVELTSFVRPDRVPALADAEEMCAATASSAVVRWGLVLNERGAGRALAAGLAHLQFVVSVSAAHNVRNAGRTVEASVAELGAIAAIARPAGAVVGVTVATAFGCPYQGAVPAAEVISLVGQIADLGVDSVSLADTIGTAVPGEVGSLVAAVGGRHPEVKLGLHLHDTRGLAMANAFAGLAAGAVQFDAALGGLGGCPFAPGATGNLAIEDLAHALVESGYEVGVDVDSLITASSLACTMVGRKVESHVGVAGRRFASLAPSGG